ncbi:MAG: tripartite tricarboxylate transporter TctB family protein [Sedimentisphaerales bacterium]|nr:tripartite tricarboxylate transporter TctB family protein [Sedimentisphaerales bacterium]
MNTKLRDRLGSVLMLMFVGIIWYQRNYMTPLGGIFPDRVMLILAFLSILLLVNSFRSTPAAADEKKEPAAAAEKNWLDLTVVALILLGWVSSLGLLGFFVTGVSGFSGISIFLARRELSIKVIVKSIGLALIMTYGLILIFAKLLLVPLPAGTLFN